MLRCLSILFILTLFSCAGNNRIVTTEPPLVTKTTTNKPKKSTAPKRKLLTTSLEWQLEKGFDFNKHFAGLVVYDLKKKRKLFDHNGSKYFTPASNLKLFTFYVCHKIFNDKPLSLFEYLDRPEGLYIKGTGHPGFLHPQLESDIELIHFLRKFEKDIFFSPGNFLDAPLGSGWAWDDATSAYQCEKSGFPVHGNIMAVYKEANSNEWTVSPNTLQDHISLSDQENKRPKRHTKNNTILIPNEINPKQKYLSYLPIKTSDSLIMKIISDTLYRKVRSGVVDARYKKYSQEDQDQLFHKMLYDSDNMISEQLLLHASYTVLIP